MKNTRALHCVGNGNIMAYYDRADIRELFGSPYTAPSVLSTAFMDCEQPVYSSLREGQPVWDTTLFCNGEEVGTVTDYALPESCCLVREFRCSQPVKMNIAIGKDLSVGCFPLMDYTQFYPGTEKVVMIETRGGNYAYGTLPLGFEQFYNIMFYGSIRASINQEKTTVEVEVMPGESRILFVSGCDYEDIFKNTAQAAELSQEDMHRQTAEEAKKCLDRCAVLKQLHEDTPRLNEVRQAIVGTIWNIKSQQSESGDIIAGHLYHLGYVRDQFGTARGLLALGLQEEVRAVIEYFTDTFSYSGYIKNAQGCGVRGIFHPAENDEVEITAYLILLIGLYYDASGDEETVKKALPMMIWAYRCLRRNIKNGMLPFNGDETYIAGGILPRSCMNDGSSEGSMLFVEACEVLLSLNGTVIELDQEMVLDIQEAETDVRNKFQENFCKDGRLMTNNPSFRDVYELEYAYGVCYGMDRLEGCHGFSWLKKNENGLWLCPNCMTKGITDSFSDQIYYIDTVSLMAEYIGSDMLDKKMIADTIIETAESKNFFHIVGYDYGLTLYGLAAIGHPLAEKYFNCTLDAMDECFAWNEYYEDGVALGCRYRPWESGINIEGILLYLKIQGYMN